MSELNNSATKNLWNESYGIKFVGRPEKPGKPPPTDAIPARNGIWDSEYAKNLDRVALHGFTIAELTDLGALAATNEETNILPNNLEGDVHPAFSIDKWETSVPTHFERKHMFPLGPDSNGRVRPGNYTANNLVVWKELLPCLRLASKFVENAHIIPWYAAFLFSPLHEVTNTTSQAKKLAKPLRKLYLMRQSEFNKPEMAKAIRDRILRISLDIRLGISDGNADPTGANSELKVNYDGVAIPSWEDDNHHHRIYIAYQAIEPLLENDIGPSTKLALQFHVALTLLHEFSHVLLFAKAGSRSFEVYLDNERISEAGFSFETNVFGGHPVLLLQYTKIPDYDGPLRAGFLLEDWLGTAKAHQWLEPLSGTEIDWNAREWREARSIPISFLEELGQEDFWRCFVSKWGAEALKVYPWTEGRLVQRVGNTLKTQIYSTPKLDHVWLDEALQLSHQNPSLLTSEERIAFRFASRRISRDKEISRLVKARRSIKEWIKKGHSEIEEPVGDILQDGSPVVVTAEPGDLKPWQKRMEEVKMMKISLIKQIDRCAEQSELIKGFLKRTDRETPEYRGYYAALSASNQQDCNRFRELVYDAFDSELFESYKGILQGYEAMKDDLGRVSRQSSVDRKERMEDENDDRCGNLLRRARACRDRREYKKCCDYCKQILQNNYVCHNYRAGAFLLCGLSTSDLKWKVWYLSEAVRVYRLMEHFEGENLAQTTLIKRQHAEERYAEAVTELKASTTLEESKPLLAYLNTTKLTSPTNDNKTFIKSEDSDASNAILADLNTQIFTKSEDSKPAATTGDGKTRKPFTGFGNPPSSPPTPPFDSDPPPRDMSSDEVMRYRLTFKVINQARRNFLNQDYDLAERGFLELLNLPTTSKWQKARCHVFLASIPSRTDRVERARRALKMYRRFLHDSPEDQRCIKAVKDAEELVRRVLADTEMDNATAKNAASEEGKAATRVMRGDPKKRYSGGRLDTIVEGDSNSDDEIKRGATTKAELQTAMEEQHGFVAGMLSTVTSFLGLKRRREDDSATIGPRKQR